MKKVLLCLAIIYSLNVNAQSALNTAFILNGSTYFLEMANPANLLEPPKITVEAWIKRGSSTTANTETIIASSTLNSGWAFGLAPGGILNIGQRGVSKVDCSTPITDITWHHVAITYNKTVTQKVTFYIDGAYINEVSYSASLQAPPPLTNYYIGGAMNDANTYMFKGTIDEVRIWNTIRTGAEIANNKCVELSGTETGLILYYKMNSTATNALISDASPSQNNATITAVGGNGPFTCNDISVASNPACVVIVAPTLTTTTATSISQTAATSGGNISSDGGANVSVRGVCWSTSTSPIATGNFTTDGTGTGSFTSNITSLSQGTTYYVRAYATNSVGTAYGNEVTFNTVSGINDLEIESFKSLYPNPATNQLTINLGGLQAEQVNIYNVDGKLVSQTKQPANNRIDINNLATGVYIAEVNLPAGQAGVRDAVQRVRWVKM